MSTKATSNGDRRPKAATPWRVRVSIVGPCYPEYGGQPDRTTREVTVEVDIDLVEHGWSSDNIEFQLSAYRSRRDAGGWFDPCIRPLAFQHYGRAISLDQAEHAVKHLKAVRRYIAGLPVPPQNIGDFVRIIGKLYHFDQLELFQYPDLHTQPRPVEYLTVGGLARQVQEAYDNLAPKEEVS